MIKFLTEHYETSATSTVYVEDMYAVLGQYGQNAVLPVASTFGGINR